MSDKNNPNVPASESMGHHDHHAYVEDAPQEEAGEGGDPAWGETMSAKAAGKRPETTEPKKPIDLSSHELFPSLGGGGGGKGPGLTSTPGENKATAAPMWGPSNGHTNGSDPASAPSSRMTTPALNLPGRNVASAVPTNKNHVESIIIGKEHILPRDKLKRSIQDIIKDHNRRSRVVITMGVASDGRHKFNAKGPIDVAQQALKDLVQQIGTKAVTTISIPQSSRAHIIGKGGSTIKGIQDRTGARIRFPKADEVMDDDEEAEIEITIEGNAISAAIARDEILKIVGERSASVQSKLKGIPSAFYPFLAARTPGVEEAHRVRIQVPTLSTLFMEPVPCEAEQGKRPVFASTDGSYIQIHGERSSVQRSRAEIERLAADLHKSLHIKPVGVDHGSQQFIVGEHGITMDDFFSDTGCAVLLPPEGSTGATLVGPEDCLEKGWERALNLVEEMRNQPFHLSRGSPDVTYARNVTRYLRHRGEIVRLQKTHGTVIQTPPHSTTWNIYSRQMRNVLNAQAELTKILAGLPTTRLATVPVDPFFHSHLQKNIASRVRQNYGVQMIVPEAGEGGEPVLLVYEAPFQADGPFSLPTSQPGKKDADTFKRGLRDAEQHILELIKKQDEIQSFSIDVPHKFHDKLKRFIKQEKEKLPEEQVPMRVSAAGSKVTLRGPASVVKDMGERVEKFIEQEKKDEKERDFSLSFDFPQKFASHIIGKQGSKITELRDKFDVEIQVDKGVVTLKGPKAKAEAAKSHILSLGRSLEDETTYNLKIDAKFHGELIGSQGANINRLQTRYPGVHIFFPRTAKPTANDDSDAVSESERQPRRQQAADEVVIRGPKKAADQTRDELFDLYKHIKDTSFTATVKVPQKQIPSIIGQGGRELDALRMSSGARIDIPADRDVEMVEIQLKGTQAQVALAKRELEDKKAVFENTIVKTIDVDRKYHKTLIGPGGSTLRDMVVRAGGKDDRRTIQFPKQDSDANTIKVEGPTKVVDKIVAEIEEKVSEWGSQVTEVVDVPVEQHRSLIGRGGEAKRQMEAKLGVTIDIPRQGDGKTGVKITGRPEKVADAKAHVESLVKDQQGETVQVPRALHHTIGNNGQFFRRLRNDFHVTVDHAGQAIPAKPGASSTAAAPANGGSSESAPLITDEEPAAPDAHRWTVVAQSSSSPSSEKGTGEQGDIAWVLRGSADNVAKARKALADALEQAKRADSTGYLSLADPRTYRFVIGPGGSRVNAIRKQSGCKINVPRDHEPIEVVGSKEGIEKAKEMILQAVREGGSKGGARE